MTPNISREDEPSGRFVSLEEKLEILDRLKSGGKLTYPRKKLNKNSRNEEK